MDGSSRSTAYGAGSERKPDARGEASVVEVVERLPIAIVLVKASGVIALSSNAAARALNTSQPLAGRRIEDVLGSLETLLGHRGSDTAITVEGPDGKCHRFGYSIAKVGQGLHAVVFRDITHRAHVASERDRLVHLAAVGASAPAVVHELKNSMAALTMGLELLAEDIDDAELTGNATALSEEAESVALRLDAFGATSRPPRARRPMKLDQTVCEARRSLTRLAQDRGIDLQWHLHRLPSVYLDPGIVHTLTVALTTNALEASERGQSVRVSLGVLDGSFVLTVVDEGSGMSPDVVHRCRELFFSGRGRGRGIGLTICDQAVRAGGGTLDIESREGHGTMVVVELPRATEFER